MTIAFGLAFLAAMVLLAVRYGAAKGKDKEVRDEKMRQAARESAKNDHGKEVMATYEQIKKSLSKKDAGRLRDMLRRFRS